jgi:apolipoprotein N-acyltransferase
MLSHYGIHASFTPGTHASIFPIHNQRIAPLICYEETFSDYACQAYQLHPTMLIGLSNDVWYPNVRHQHFELARLRAAELGIPLIRSCNFGISAAVSSTGDVIGSAGLEDTFQNSCFIAHIPTTSHFSFFALIGERMMASILLIIGTIVCCYKTI